MLWLLLYNIISYEQYLHCLLNLFNIEHYFIMSMLTDYRKSYMALFMHLSKHIVYIIYLPILPPPPNRSILHNVSITVMLKFTTLFPPSQNNDHRVYPGA